MGLKNPTFTNVSLRFYGGKGGIMDEKCIRLFEVTQETNRPNNHKRPGEKIKMQNKKESELRISNTKCASQSKGPVAKENNMPEPIQSKEFNETWTWEAKSLCKDTQTKRSNKNRGLIKRQQRNPKSQSEHGRRRNIGRCQNRKLGTSQGSNENRHVAALGFGQNARNFRFGAAQFFVFLRKKSSGEAAYVVWSSFCDATSHDMWVSGSS